ncbi:hypothetical protein [Peptoanaerobacter stomatis]
MGKIDDISNAIIILIGSLVVVRGLYLFIKMMFNPDEKETYIKKLATTVKAFILSLSAFTIKTVIEYYFK